VSVETIEDSARAGGGLTEYATDPALRPPPLSQLTDQQQRDLDAVLGGSCVSLHDHPFLLPDPLTKQSWQRHWDSRRERIAEAGLASSGLAALFASSLVRDDLDSVLYWASTTATSIHRASGLQLARHWKDVGLPGVAVFLALEDLGLIGAQVSDLDALFGCGIRSAGLAYNTGSALAGGLAQPTDPGLSAAGREAIGAMESLGMVVDLAHVGDSSSLQAAAVAAKPVVISHAGARALWPTPRMKPDSVIRAVADTGGLIGLEAAPGSTRTRPDSPEHNLDDVMRHLEYIAELVGIEHVALGPDTFFGDHVNLYRVAGWKPSSVPDGAPTLDIEQVSGMDNPQEAPVQTAAWLLAHGWNRSDVVAVLGGNAVRVMSRLLK